MIRWLRIYLACWLAPELQRDAERYRHLRMTIDTAHQWMAVQVPDAETLAQWLLERDTDHWRAAQARPIGKLPDDLRGLRELMLQRSKGGA